MSINKPIISPHQKDKVELVKLTNSMSRAEKEKALTEALIRQGWKLVEEKQMDKSTYEKFARRVLNVLGIERIKNLHEFQQQSLNNQLQDLIEEHDYIIDTVTDDEIMGRYKLVTEHIYPSDFVQMSEMLKDK